MLSKKFQSIPIRDTSNSNPRWVHTFPTIDAFIPRKFSFMSFVLTSRAPNRTSKFWSNNYSEFHARFKRKSQSEDSSKPFLLQTWKQVQDANSTDGNEEREGVLPLMTLAPNHSRSIWEALYDEKTQTDSGIAENESEPQVCYFSWP